jgi:hypothetical protein
MDPSYCPHQKREEAEEAHAGAEEEKRELEEKP